MGSLQTATLTINEDEPCWSLREYDAPVQGKQHRFQEIRVIRDQKVVVWLDVLGPSENFVGNTFNIVCGNLFPDHRIEVYHTVGQAREQADRERNTPTPDIALDDEVDWRQQWADQMDRERMEAAKQSIFGAKFGKMRY